MKDKPLVKKSVAIEERFGKENLSNITSAFEKPPESGPKQPREAMTLVDKEQYSSVKNKFEHPTEEMGAKATEKRALIEMDLPATLGADNVAERKHVFEKLQDQKADLEERKQIEIERSEADRKRVKETFFETPDKKEARECAVCGRTVYSVEKLLLEKRVYHKACFKCHTCQKALSVQGYAMHEGNLYCKLHILEIYRPDFMLAHEGTLEADMADGEDEEEDYVLVTKPKVLDPSVVRSALKSNDDFEHMPKLKSMKARWEEAPDSPPVPVEKRAADVEVLIQQGKVKSRLSRFTNGDAAAESSEEDEPHRDQNLVRGSKKKKEKIQLNIDAKSIKNKWETGTVRNVNLEQADRSQELEELKKNVPVKERYKTRSVDETPPERRPVPEEEQLDTSFTKNAKEKFLNGEAFQEAAPEKSKEEIHFAEMGNVKQRFEKGQSTDDIDNDKVERPVPPGVVRFSEMDSVKASFEQGKTSNGDTIAEIRKQKIEAEFKKIKKEKRLLQEKEKREAEELANTQGTVAEETIAEEIRAQNLQSIKKSFEDGKAFLRDENGNDLKHKWIENGLETKVASKAREKFKKLDQEGPDEMSRTFSNRQDSKRIAQEKLPRPEPVNRRNDQIDGDDEEAYEMKCMLNKFKVMELQAGREEEMPKEPKAKRQITPPPEGYRAVIESTAADRNPDVVTGDVSREIVGIEAKSIKEKFEQGPEALGIPKGPKPDEKRKRLEEEFQKIKEIREQQKQEESKPSDDPPLAEQEDPALVAAVGRAQKARAKWDKIQRKEARKAEKAAKRALGATEKQPQISESAES